MNDNKRSSWDDYFMSLAKLASTRSTCDRANVGCVLVKDNRIVATGYNGSVSGTPHCDDVGHMMHHDHCVRTIHAEQNAVTQCALTGVSSKGCVAYVTHYPCINCSKVLLAAGIKEVVYLNKYGSTSDDDILLSSPPVLVRMYKGNT